MGILEIMLRIILVFFLSLFGWRREIREIPLE